MDPSIQSLFDAALKLPDADRSDLVFRLLETLPPPEVLRDDAPDFEQELERRFADQSDAIPWLELRAEQ